MKDLKDRLNITKAILRSLSRQPTSRVELSKQAIRAGGSYASFTAIFCFLQTEGYIEKSGVELRAPYRITEKGSRRLEAL